MVLAVLLAGCASRPVADTARSTSALSANTVILVSIDGLPASMLGTGILPTLDHIAADGVHARWMTPSVPTHTFPNHYTLVTGLRPDNHGIVNNQMIDPTLGRFVSKEASADDGRWWGGEPIWATLQKQGGIAATMFWPGSRARIAGERPRYSLVYDRAVAANARVDQVLQWLDLPPAQRPTLLTLYFEQYDVAAHASGARSERALQALSKVDTALARLQRGLRQRGLLDATNLIVVSDHGMADVPIDHVTYLNSRLGTDAYDVMWWGAFVGIVPKPGQTDAVERAFLGRQDHYHCWRKSELPPAWGYGQHPRIPAIICQSDTGWRVQAKVQRRWLRSMKGEHGYAPEAPAMRAVFVASGPAFKSQVQLPPFANVDVYSLLAHLLGVTPAENDGSLASTEAALR